MCTRHCQFCLRLSSRIRLSLRRAGRRSHLFYHRFNYYTLHGWCPHHIENIRNSIVPLHSAILDGLASDDIEDAFLSAGVYAGNCFTSSIPLSDLQNCLRILHQR